MRSITVRDSLTFNMGHVYVIDVSDPFLHQLALATKSTVRYHVSLCERHSLISFPLFFRFLPIGYCSFNRSN